MTEKRISTKSKIKQIISSAIEKMALYNSAIDDIITSFLFPQCFNIQGTVTLKRVDEHINMISAECSIKEINTKCKLQIVHSQVYRFAFGSFGQVKIGLDFMDQANTEYFQVDICGTLIYDNKKIVIEESLFNSEYITDYDFDMNIIHVIEFENDAIPDSVQFSYNLKLGIYATNYPNIDRIWHESYRISEF